MPEQTSPFEILCQRLCANVKLERDKALQELEKIDFQESDIIALHSWIVDKLDCNASWEEVYGALVAGRVLLAHCEFNTLKCTGLIESLVMRLPRCHEHDEYRIRIVSGECMGELCRAGGFPLFNKFIGMVKTGIRDNLTRQVDPALLQQRMNAEEVFHDTAGWKSLETWMKSLQCLIAGLGPRFSDYQDVELLDIIFEGIAHTNRFVRESGYQLLGTLAEMQGCRHEDSLIKVAKQLAVGLADNWSQVRMAASVATRQFFSHLNETEQRDRVYPILLPPMCLNRYYVAEGVRLYSQETWRIVTGEKGKLLVETYLQETLHYYITQTDADNHAVREAACNCLSEAACKLDRDLLRPHVPNLLSALAICFEDDAWPVRDVACVSTGALVAAFPDEALTLRADAFVDLLSGNLRDSIPSVRQGGAAALASVAVACGGEVLKKVISITREELLSVKDQKADSQSHPGVSPSPATYSVVRTNSDVITEEQDDRHTNQQMYSCGSLAPKMRKGGGGCHDGHFRRPSDPWEVSDGCILLLTELAVKGDATLHQNLIQLLPKIGEAAELTHYSHHDYLLETVCKCVPRLCQALGKRLFKSQLECLLPHLCRALDSDVALTRVAGEEALRQLAQALGPNILRGRIEMLDPNLLGKVATLF